jgi:Raf kinase inhibitor-like YbhB/YbcL family protein
MISLLKKEFDLSATGSRNALAPECVQGFPVQRMGKIAVFVVFFIVLGHNPVRTEVRDMTALKISSPAFRHNEHIPAKYTCDGTDVNPALAIENAPAGAKSLALIVDDPDAPAGTWVHWVVWNIGPETREIKEHTVPSGASQGMTDFRKRSYGGPCPPSGTHRYFFKLYALDTVLNIGADSTKATVERAMQGHILTKAELIGLYKRK